MRTPLALALALPLALAGTTLAHAADTHEVDLEKGLARAAKEKKLVVVEVSAESCGVCKAMEKGPLADKKVKKLLGERVFVKLDADKDKPQAARYEPMSMPTFAFLSPRGVIVDKHIGFLAKDDLVKKLEDAVAKAKEADEQLDEMEKACERDPKDFEARKTLADFWKRAGNHHEAAANLAKIAKDESLGTDARRLQAWADMAKALVILQRNGEAIVECDALAKVAKDNLRILGPALLLKGFALEAEKRIDEAKAAYKACAEQAKGSQAAAKAEAQLKKLDSAK